MVGSQNKRLNYTTTKKGKLLFILFTLTSVMNLCLFQYGSFHPSLSHLFTHPPPNHSPGDPHTLATTATPP